MYKTMDLLREISRRVCSPQAVDWGFILSNWECMTRLSRHFEAAV